MLTADIKKLERNFFPKDFAIADWNSLEPYFKNLAERKIESKNDLEQWLKDLSEVEAIVSEDVCWRQIKMTCDTENKALEDAFTFFMMELQPKIQPYADKLNRKLMDCPFTKELDEEKYFTYLRSIKKSIELFREENIPLQADMNVLQQQYGVIAGKMTVEINGKEFTLQQASVFLENPDRNLREETYLKMNERRKQDADALNNLYSTLIEKRHQIALNAGFDNYVQYRFKELGRFDYTVEDCFQFHQAVKQHILPLVNIIYKKKKQKLGVETLRPWDLEAEAIGVQPLKPFKTSEELVQKTIQCFEKINPFFGECIRKMKSLGHLDLESRKGKAPGGYNCPLAESGAPFIFMNAAGQMSDVTTMLHEGGHAIHSFLAHELELSQFKEYPMEIAELASMSMELMSMNNWNVFFDDEVELKRAKEHQLERVITIFPWIAIIDKFQHWVYTHPQHTIEERKNEWIAILNEFMSPEVDFSGLEAYREIGWQRQLHLFEVPFYYIEYGIAQLGAIGLWKQFIENPQQAIEHYIAALSLGGTKDLKALYNAAGLSFDFSPSNIQSLAMFVKDEMEKL